MLQGSKILSKQAKSIFKTDCLLRSKHSTEGLLQCANVAYAQSNVKKIQDYPPTRQLPLPSNIEDFASSEKIKFSPQRNRDISGSFISSCSSSVDKEVKKTLPVDERIELYDCSGPINLSSAMQSNVPFPFTGKGKPTHLNMPGGQWRQSDKYTSHDLNNVHHSNNRSYSVQTGGTYTLGVKKGSKNTFFCLMTEDSTLLSRNLWSNFCMNQINTYRTCKNNKESVSDKLEKQVNKVPKKSLKEKLKAAIRDYGSVVLVFHIGISLISLGCCYLAVASGVDLSGLLTSWGLRDEGANTAGAAAQFVVAYAIHKAMAPGRIAITLTAVPFLVKKLRKAGLLKPPKSKPQ